MAVPDYSALNADGAAMLEFMKSSLVLTGRIGDAKAKNKPEFLELVKDPIYTGTMGGSPIDVYTLKKSDKTSKSGALQSFICDYKSTKIRYVTLDKTANYCFTITMNGCSFGIGTPASDGTVLVSHCNRADTGANMRHEQMKTIVQGHGGGAKLAGVLNPALYKMDVVGDSSRRTATTFGIRTGGTWKFYFQLFKSEQGVLNCLGVFPVPTTQVNT